VRILGVTSLLACAACSAGVAHPVAQVTSKRLTVASQKVAVELSNPSGRTIHGLVRLSKATPHRVGESRLVSHSARYGLGPHADETVRVRLTPVGRSALREHRTIGVNVAVRPRVGTAQRTRLRLSR
jgi:hypothetical protein